MDTVDHSLSWWKVIEAMSDYIACGFDYEDLEDDCVQFELLAQGFDKHTIEQALDWLEMASISGQVAEVFSMIRPQVDATRIASPLEKVCFSEKLWQQFEKIRTRGLIGDDLAERILEGMRALDTRDWEDDEVREFIFDVLSASIPNVDDRSLKRLLVQRRVAPEFYS